MAEWHQSAEWKKAREYAKTVLEPICVACGKELIGGDWTIDHIAPPTQNGEGAQPNNDISNLQSMCRSCNGRKQDRQLIRVAWKSARW